MRMFAYAPIALVLLACHGDPTSDDPFAPPLARPGVERGSDEDQAEAGGIDSVSAPLSGPEAAPAPEPVPEVADADCTVADAAELGTPEQENPLTFWWSSGDPAELRPALECALERIRAATCLPVDVSLDARHLILQRPPEEMGGRIGWTFGTFDAARIALKTPMGPLTNCRILVHEIAQHVLRRRNDHAGASQRLDQALIDSICSVQDCGCSNPETDDNPIPSTERLECE